MLDATDINWVPFSTPTTKRPRPETARCEPAPHRAEWAPYKTFSDLVIAELADGEAEALAHAAALSDENGLLHEMVSAALEQLSRSDAHLQAARASIVSLRAAERSRLCGACRRSAA